MKDLKPFKTNTKSASEAKIKESKIATDFNAKFQLETFEPMTTLEVMSMDPLMKKVKEIYNELRPLQPRTNAVKYSLQDILSNPDYLQQLLPYMTKIEELTSKEDVSTFAAALLRINRFKLKWIVISLLHTKSPIPNLALGKKLELLDKELTSTFIHLNLKEIPKQGPQITFQSTLALLAKHLVSCEMQLKTLLPGLIMSHSLLPPGGGFDSKIIHNLLLIAPDGFVGLEGDYYYICRLLLGSHRLPFNDLQKKQWDTYYHELTQVFQLYLIPELIYDFSYLMQDNNTINLPFKTFITQEELSSNTFSRLVNALTLFTMNVWLLLLVILSKKYLETGSSK